MQKWIVGSDTFSKNIAPGDESPQKFLRLDIPKNAPKDLITIEIEVYRDGSLISSPSLDFDITQQNFFQVAMC